MIHYYLPSSSILFFLFLLLLYYYTHTFMNVLMSTASCGFAARKQDSRNLEPVAEMSFTTSLPTVLDALKSKSVPVYAIPLTGQVVGDKGVKFIAKSLLKERSFNGIKSPYHPIDLCDFSSCALTDGCLKDIAKIIDSIKTVKEIKPVSGQNQLV